YHFILLLFFLCREVERIPLRPTHLGRFLRLRFRHIPRIHGDDAGTSLVRSHHHLVCVAFVHAKDRLEHHHDELSWRIVVVEQDDLPQRRALRFWLRFCPRFFERLLAHPGASRRAAPRPAVHRSGPWRAFRPTRFLTRPAV